VSFYFFIKYFREIMNKIYIFMFVVLSAKVTVLTSLQEASMLACAQTHEFIRPGSPADQAAVAYLTMQERMGRFTNWQAVIHGSTDGVSNRHIDFAYALRNHEAKTFPHGIPIPKPKSQQGS
jgi:hypothetical protein